MRLTLRDELPFVTLTLVQRGVSIVVPSLLVDTGSASTLISGILGMDLLRALGAVLNLHELTLSFD